MYVTLGTCTGYQSPARRKNPVGGGGGGGGGRVERGVEAPPPEMLPRRTDGRDGRQLKIETNHEMVPDWRLVCSAPKPSRNYLPRYSLF
ncbi:hypothetical protein LX36DRAFT_654402 [Colletotrichum falcatum]|nr:hypothetical protein LX36DRAFT_654402 [Colletotrichum falcatum]